MCYETVKPVAGHTQSGYLNPTVNTYSEHKKGCCMEDRGLFLTVSIHLYGITPQSLPLSFSGGQHTLRWPAEPENYSKAKQTCTDGTDAPSWNRCPQIQSLHFSN